MESTVLKVQLVYGDASAKTLTFDDPATNLTLTQIQTAFNTLLANGWLLDQSGNAFSSVSEASYVTTTPIA